MAKKCNSCGFQQNPDNAHYCGKCGKQLGYSDNFKLYNASLQTPVYDSTLNNYMKYERQVNSSWLFNTGDKIKRWWNESGKDNAQTTLVVLAMLCVIWGIVFAAKLCSFDNKISRIEIDGKYGIGYNKDKMLVPALYDSIVAYETGNQWILYDLDKRTLGLAYVTDSVVNLMEPSKTEAIQITINANGLAMLQIKDRLNTTDVWRVARKGIYENATTYKCIVYPGVTWDKNACLVATRNDGGMQMLGTDGMPINGKTYNNIVIDPDSMIRAIDYTKNGVTTTIHDYTGKQTSDKVFYWVNAFSDGVAWAYLTSQDRKKYSHSLIDKNGNDLFQIEAQNVYPFTMGLGPVYKGSSYSNQKLGFVDKTGKTVIPFKYKSKNSNPHFGTDSLMLGISLDGVEGKLHRNGTFIPNK